MHLKRTRVYNKAIQNTIMYLQLISIFRGSKTVNIFFNFSPFSDKIKDNAQLVLLIIISILIIHNIQVVYTIPIAKWSV